MKSGGPECTSVPRWVTEGWDYVSLRLSFSSVKWAVSVSYCDDDDNGGEDEDDEE